MRRSFFRLIAFFRSRHAESELSREIAAHLQLLEDQFVVKGMTVADARFAARRAFGRFILPAVAALMTLVGLAAAWGPARRGLRVELTETLRAD